MSGPAYPPGVWVDGAGVLHFDLEAMVRGAGYEPTPENLATMERAATEMAAKVGAVVETVTERPAFTCPVCGAVSYHPADVLEGYCGRCHVWTGIPRPDPSRPAT